MCTRKSIGVFLAAGFVLVLGFALRPDPHRRFARYLGGPVPASVRVVAFHSNDWLAANPEPVCYLAFSASVEDMAEVTSRGGFRPASTNDPVPVPPGPLGWVTAEQIGPAGRVYARSHAPTGAGRGPYVGWNRRWSEFLWIDSTGTNAYFLLWGV